MMCVNLLEKFIEKCELLEMNHDESCTPLTRYFQMLIEYVLTMNLFPSQCVCF